MRGGGQIIFRGHFWKMPVKLFPSEFLSWFLALRVELAGAGRGRSESIRKVSFTS